MTWQWSRFVLSFFLIVLMLACGAPSSEETVVEIVESSDEDLADPEIHLANLQQLTFGGENAEAYFTSDGSELIFQ